MGRAGVLVALAIASGLLISCGAETDVTPRDSFHDTIVPNPFCPGAAGTCGVSSIIQNAPVAHVYGWENEFTFTPAEHLSLPGTAQRIVAATDDPSPPEAVAMT